MEVSTSPKHLSKHALPISMIIFVFLSLPIVAIKDDSIATLPTGAAMIRAGVTPLVHIQPTANGLAKITLGATPNPTAGSSLSSGLASAGSTAQLSLNLQAPALSQ